MLYAATNTSRRASIISRAHGNRISRRVFGVHVGTIAAGLAVGSGAIAGERGKWPDLVAVTGGETLSNAPVDVFDVMECGLWT